MVKAYLAGISSLYEGEDIEVRFTVYEDQALISKDSIMLGYEKPALVGEVAMLTLLKELEKYKNKEITILVNDGALCECIRGTTTTRNRDVLNKAKEIRKELTAFEKLEIKDVSVNHVDLKRWNEELHW